MQHDLKLGEGKTVSSPQKRALFPIGFLPLFEQADGSLSKEVNNLKIVYISHW